MENKSLINHENGNDANRLLAAVLESADLFENVECDINGDIKLMNEYRILVEPNSQEEFLLSRLLYGS
jgi:hypothetical protein